MAVGGAEGGGDEMGKEHGVREGGRGEKGKRNG